MKGLAEPLGSVNQQEPKSAELDHKWATLLVGV